MATNGFQLAIEHATAEINDIDNQLQKLTRRKFQTEKILDCLKELVAESDPVSTTAIASAAPVPETAAPQAPVAETAAPETPELEAVLKQAAELEASAQETPAQDAIAHEAHEHALEHEGESTLATEIQQLHEYSDVNAHSAAGGLSPSAVAASMPRIRMGF